MTNVLIVDEEPKIRDTGSHFDPQTEDLFLELMDNVLEIKARHVNGHHEGATVMCQERA